MYGVKELRGYGIKGWLPGTRVEGPQSYFSLQDYNHQLTGLFVLEKTYEIAPHMIIWKNKRDTLGIL